MNTRHSIRWFWLSAVCLTFLFFANKAATQSQIPTQKPDVKTAGGLTTVTFYLEHGDLTVNLPDDMRAGDTISGTVVAEPKGQTKDERAKNQSELNGLVVEIEGKRVEPFATPPAKERESVIQQTFWIYRPATQPTSRRNATTESGGAAKFSIALVKNEPNGQEVARVLVPYYVGQSLAMTPSGAVITPNPKTTPSFNIPGLAQAGRPIVITGPFDGNSSNTSLRPAVQDFEKNTENVSAGFELIAESPRKAVFQAPTNSTGSHELTLKEGNTETKGTYRNVGVNLSAPKTNLLKGERTTLTVEVNGLQGITQPVPLTLESRGVINMEGGMYQPLVIQPSQVGADGRYTTMRGITGIQTGGWSATATVVTHPFDVCLQDDSNGDAFIFRSDTGDYIFFQPSAPATKSVVLPWIAQTRGALVQQSDLKLANPVVRINPCEIILEHNVTDRRVHAQIDTCTHAGSATVQSGSPKVKFTITDRNTKDNTCACGPGCK